MTVLENVQTALLSRDRLVFHPWRRAGRHAVDEAMALLEQTQMAGKAGQACGELAYGDVKRVELAMALAHRPRLLLMDEPTAGMATNERHALMQLTRQLADTRGIAVLFTEHSLDVVFKHADRIAVLVRQSAGGRRTGRDRRRSASPGGLSGHGSARRVIDPAQSSVGSRLGGQRSC